MLTKTTDTLLITRGLLSFKHVYLWQENALEYNYVLEKVHGLYAVIYTIFNSNGLVKPIAWVMNDNDFYSNISGFVQERRNSTANALELRLSCTNPLTCSLVPIRQALDYGAPVTTGGHAK